MEKLFFGHDLVNMIFRSDGKTNIIPANCFSEWLYTKSRNGRVKAEYSLKDSDNRVPPITKVLMNPPFPKKKTDNKEYKFIEHALKQMQDEGILFSVLPYSCMIKSGGYLEWRKRLLKSHTLLSVVTFPDDLFYPVGVHSVGIFVKKGVPHPSRQNVLWVRGINDGLLKSKGKRRPNPKALNDYPKITQAVKNFIANQSMEVENINRFQKAVPIDFDDKMLELIPENYLDQEIPTDDEIRQGIEQVVRESVAFLIKARKEDELKPH